ncbi:MAG TPA: YkgJ family cysteine cluster protein [Desulfotomaculum sp.]|nr:YkgJ family cysteine cluster protein [Desulfotomaculum sp.]
MTTTTEKNLPVLALCDKFRFACRPGLSCYTTCCRDISIFLTPNDVFRLKKHLDITSTEFLEKYTITFVAPNSGLPTVLLKMREDADKQCPFVTPEGCSVYKVRPWSCRMYPLSYDYNEDKYPVIADPSKCLGFQAEAEVFVEDWLVDQGVMFESVLFQPEIDRMFNDALARLEFPKDKITNPQITEMIYMASYDLDRFRRFVFESRFLQIFEIEPSVVERVKKDDEELARLAFLWLKFGISDRNALKIRDEVLEQSKA